jgi:hypothetical protein
MDNTPPYRRWFRFRLRALMLIIAVVSCALAWIASNLNWIQQRHEFLAAYQQKPPTRSELLALRARGLQRRPRSQQARFKFSGTIRPSGHTYHRLVLNLFGEPEYADLRLAFPLKDLGNDTIERAGQLYPEATIHWSVAEGRRSK